VETKTIAEVLGGPKVLRKIIKKPDDLAQLAREGLPATSLNVLAQRLDLGSTTVSRKLGIPRRTLTRRLSKGSRLTAAESDRSRGLRVVYASSSLALAAVETFVNLEPKLRPPDLVSIAGEVPEN
jgi:uncharacterized protein (DUF2384 family)